MPTTGDIDIMYGQTVNQRPPPYSIHKKLTAASLTVLSLFLSTAPLVHAAQWSSTEIHYQRGTLDTAFTSESIDTTILTLQHASGWSYGTNFFFVDLSSTSHNEDLYGEWYSTFSLSRITGKTFALQSTGGNGIKDIGIVLALNMGADSNVKKYLPGISLNWQLPGFTLFKTMVTAYIDDTVGDAASKQDNSYMIDWAWNYPITVGDHDFSISGHMEYISGRDNSFNEHVESWLLWQPQIRYDLGKGLFNKAGSLYIGLEFQLWENKLGDKNTDERATQLLAVWAL